MSPNYVQKFYSYECQPSGHQLSHQTIAKLWHLMVGERLRTRMSAVVQLWSKTATANLWLMTHKKIVCVITNGTDGQDFCFARFYDHNLKTIHFEVDLNQDFIFETRSSIFYVLSGSDGQSIGIKFGDKLEAKDFKIIVMEKRLKRFEQLSECKPSPDLPSNTRLKTIESNDKLHGMASDKTSRSLNTNLKTHLHEYQSKAYRGFHRISGPIRRPTTLPKTSLKPKTRSSIVTNGSVIGLQLDPILDTKIEKCFTQLSKSLQLMDSSLNQLILDVRHRRHTNQEDQPIDISLSSVVKSDKTVDTPVMGGDNQSITGSDSDKDTKVSNRSHRRRRRRFRRGVPVRKSLLYRAIHNSYHLSQQLPESAVDVSNNLTVKTAVNGHELVTDDHSDPICDTGKEDSEDIVTEDNGNQSDGEIDDYDKEYDVILCLQSEHHIRVGYGLTFWRRYHMATNKPNDAHNGRHQEPQRRVIPVDSETYNRFLEVMGDKTYANAFIRNNSLGLALDEETDGGQSAPYVMTKMPVISVESTLYKQIRDVVAIYADIKHQVIITTDSHFDGEIDGAVNGHELAIDDHSDLIRDTVEIGEGIASKDNGNHSDGGSDGNVEEYDVYISRYPCNKRKINVYKGCKLWPHKATEVSFDANQRFRFVYPFRLLQVDLETFKRFRKVITDSTSDSILTHVFIKNDSSMSKPGDESHDGHSEGKHPVISVNPRTYKQIRDVLARDGWVGNMSLKYRVVIKTDSKLSKSSKQSGRKFCWCFP